MRDHTSIVWPGRSDLVSWGKVIHIHFFKCVFLHSAILVLLHAIV